MSSSPIYLSPLPRLGLPTPATRLALHLEAAVGCGQAGIPLSDGRHLCCSVTQAGLRPAASCCRFLSANIADGGCFFPSVNPEGQS